MSKKAVCKVHKPKVYFPAHNFVNHLISMGSISENIP